MTDDEYLNELLQRAGAVASHPMRVQLLAHPDLHKAAVASTKQGRFVDIEEVADPVTFAAAQEGPEWTPGTFIIGSTEGGEPR